MNFLPSDPIDRRFQRLTPMQKTALKKLGLATIRDLLYHLPVRHIDAGKESAIRLAEDGERATITGQVEKVGTRKSFRSRVPMGEATVRDASGKMKLIWFHQPYVAKQLTPGDYIRASGTVRVKGGRALINPEIEKIPALPGGAGGSLFAENGVFPDERFFPVYPESRGITSKWFYHAMKRILASDILEMLEDPIPPDIRERYHLPDIATALVWIHRPRDEKHSEVARKRFAFEEIFFIQLERQRSRRAYESNPSFRIPYDAERIRGFTEQLDFPLTSAQKKAIHIILTDFAKARPMLRLLEGDVGSGKTAVAAATVHTIISTRPAGQNFGTLQVAYMCPTEILATQHFESFIRFFVGSGIQIGLITGSGCRKFPSKVDPRGWTDISRSQFLKWVTGGEIAVVIGTHALIQKSVVFKHLAYAIIDEQHRFGAKQRGKLVQKDGRAPHLLSMTATPIPRTLALTIFGDLDLTLLDEMPAGRKEVKTEIVFPDKRADIYAFMKNELAAGRQAYVICPRIDEPDPTKEMALNAKSVKEEAARLRHTVFPDKEIGILHSKMATAAKDKVMSAFACGEIDILVATSVVEVGVNVPNATMIVIEGAERFGLAQLHQLRGRVLRGTHQAYCWLFSESTGERSLARLKALTKAKNGFELSEMDLELRGAGELGGGRQWGISDIGMEAIKNIKMVEAARAEAALLLDEDPKLARHPSLREQINNHGDAPMHFE